MSPSKKSHPPYRDENDKTIHEHLHIQFCGVITKLIQEIDELARLMSNKETIKSLKYLKGQLSAASTQYCINKTLELNQCIMQFREACEQAISEYQKSKGVDDALQENEMSRLTINTIFDRFYKEIESSISYTCGATKEQQALSSPHLLETIKAKLNFIKEQISTIQDKNPTSDTPKSSE
jgi:hypothetical protein